MVQPQCPQRGRKAGIRLTGLIAALLGVCAPALALPPHEELRFAQELCDRDYGALAVDHLLRTRERSFLPAQVRHDATKVLARTYRILGERAMHQRNHKGKRENYENAVREYGAYLKQAAKIDAKLKADVQFESASLCSALGRDQLLGMEGTAEKEEAAEYKTEAIDWYTQAEGLMTQAADVYVKQRGRYSQAKSREDKIEYRTVREQAGRIQLERAKMLYHFAGAYPNKDEVKTRDAKLNAAVGILQGDMVKNYSIFAVKYTAHRLTGMCYQRMAGHRPAKEAAAARGKAIKHLKDALLVQPTAETKWIVWLSRYSLAQTYNDARKHDEAMVQVDALVSSLTDAIMTAAAPEEMDMYFAARIEKARALVLRATFLVGRSAQYKKQKKNMLATTDSNQARRDYNYAVSIVSEIAKHADSKWHRNAKVFLKQWIEQSEKVLGEPIRVRPDIHTLSAEGLKFYKAKKYAEAVHAFQEAIAAPTNPLAYLRTILPECWYRMGLSYYYMKQQSAGPHNYYFEAALCFEHVANAYDRAAFAVDAADVAQQLYGSIFRFTRDRLEGEETGVTQEDLMNDGRRYYSAIRLMAEKFAKDPRSRDLLFQAAEIARTIERFEHAAGIYAEVKEDHPRYHEARYRAGLCLYLEALKLYETDKETPPVSPIADLLRRSAQMYQEHLDWFDNRRGLLSGEQLRKVNAWVLRSRTGHGKLLVHDVWGVASDKKEGAKSALELMANVEALHAPFMTAEEKLDQFPQAFMVNIQAYRQLDQLAKAESFVKKIETDFGAKSKLTSTAASLVGYAYLQKRRELEKAGATELSRRQAAAKAGEWLEKGLRYDPDQTLQVYLDVGGALFQSEEYEQAIRVLLGGLDRFKIEQGKPMPEPQFKAIDGLERCYQRLAQVDARRWKDVEVYASRLHVIQPRNLDYMMDLAMALEKQGKYKKAIPIWRGAKAGAGAAKDEEFNATVHLARCYAKDGNPEHAYKVIAWVLLGSRAWISTHPDRALTVEELFDEVMKDRLLDLCKTVFDHLNTDVNPLRVAKSRKVIVDLLGRRCPARKQELDVLLRKADAGDLRDGA